MTIAFYISGHGFGHASRQVEVINRLNGTRRSRVLVRSNVSPQLLKRTVTRPYDLVPGEPDTGVLQRTSLDHDVEGTVEAAVRFYRDFPARIDEEVADFESRRVTLIVGDIPPLAFAVATRLGIPSVAIGNFTWDWIYEAHPGFLPRGADAIEAIRAAYRGATQAFQLPFSAGFDVFPRVTPVPLIARRPTRTRTDTREFFGLHPHRRTALLSFGGYGLPTLDLARLDCAADWTVVTTDPQPPYRPADVRVVSEERFVNTGFRYEDLVSACDAVITKPGYGIIAECIAARTAMLYTARGAFREYDILVRDLPRFVRATFISQADLLAGRWRASLDQLLAQPDPPEEMPVDGADVVSAMLDAL